MDKILQAFSWLKPQISNLIVFILFVTGIVIFYKQITHINFHDLVNQMKEMPVGNFLFASIFTIAGYTALIGYDWSALRYVGKKLPLPFVAFTSFIGYSLSNTIGVSWLSGGAVRYRLYSRVGISQSQIAMIIAFCVVGFGIGELLVGGLALSLHPDILANYFSLPSWFVRATALVLLGFVFITLLLRSRSHGELRWRKSVFKLPSTNILAGQLLFSLMDIAFAGAALYILLPDSELPFLTFLAVYAIALVISVLSHVPGGVGVFEAVIVTAFQNTIPLDALTVALLSYRIIYYLLPFLVGVLLLILSEGYLTLKERWSGVSQLEGTLAGV
ncbi:MAG: lysylphosphatidylglycerol synthase domain-containing protein, partial [Psychromonas sp.]